MSFDDFLRENRSGLLGHYLLLRLTQSPPSWPRPYPPAVLSEEQLDRLVEDLEASMPTASMIYDLKNWDLQFRDVLGDDWYFDAVFGPESSLEESAETLGEVFRKQVERLDIDYDQQADPDNFRELVSHEALAFVRDWRERVINRFSGTDRAGHDAI